MDTVYIWCLTVASVSYCLSHPVTVFVLSALEAHEQTFEAALFERLPCGSIYVILRASRPWCSHSNVTALLADALGELEEASDITRHVT